MHAIIILTDGPNDWFSVRSFFANELIIYYSMQFHNICGRPMRGHNAAILIQRLLLD